jgi:hypothetical protein
MKIEYKKMLDVQWELRRAELRAKTEWDGTVQYGKDSLLYELAHEKVKDLRKAQMHLEEMTDMLRKTNQLEYSD